MAIEFGNIDIRTQVEKVENIIASLEELKLENYHNGARDIMYSETTSDIVLSAIKFFGTSAEISYRRKNVLDSLVRELDSLSSLRGGIYDAIEFSKRKIKNLFRKLSSILYNKIFNEKETNKKVILILRYINDLYSAIVTIEKGEKILLFIDSWKSKMNNYSLEKFIDYAKKALDTNYNIAWTDAYDRAYRQLLYIINNSLSENKKRYYDELKDIMFLVASYIPIDTTAWDVRNSYFQSMQNKLINENYSVEGCQLGGAFRKYNEYKEIYKRIREKLSKTEKNISFINKYKIWLYVAIVMFVSCPLLYCIIRFHNGFLKEAIMTVVMIATPFLVNLIEWYLPERRWRLKKAIEKSPYVTRSPKLFGDDGSDTWARSMLS